MSEIVHHNGLIDGNLRFDDGSSNIITLTTPSISSDYTLTLPVDSGTSGQALITNGSGVTSWSTVGGSSLTFGTTTQSTDNTTAVTLNAEVGVINIAAGTIAANSAETFTWTNSFISTTSVIQVNANGVNNLASRIHAMVTDLATGSCNVQLANSWDLQTTWMDTVTLHFRIYNE